MDLTNLTNFLYVSHILLIFDYLVHKELFPFVRVLLLYEIVGIYHQQGALDKAVNLSILEPFLQTFQNLWLVRHIQIH